MKYLLYYILLLFISSCSHKDKINDDSNTTDSIIHGALDNKAVKLKGFKYEDIARFSIASVMGQDPASIEVKFKNDVYHLKYSRESDNKVFLYKVKFKGSQVIWRVEDGKWRDSDADEKISFIEKGNRIEIIQTFLDGSESIDKYPL